MGVFRTKQELKNNYHRDYSAYIENPFFPDTKIKAIWK